METDLYTIIRDRIEIPSEHREALAEFFGKGCREKTKKRLRSICLYSLNSIELCGVLQRVEYDPDYKGIWSYCAGQSYTDEIRTARNVILGR
jgi:hypothetical protein